VSETPHDETGLDALRLRIRAFAEARDWEHFHTPKNLAMALAVEAAELMEPLQWLTSDQATADALDEETRAQLEDEIADVAIYLIRFADVVGVDVEAAVLAKIGRNEGRFPVEDGGSLTPRTGAGAPERSQL